MLALAASGAAAAPVMWAGNGHYYDFIRTPVTWFDAVTASAASSYMGMSGYLATATSAGEWDFLDADINPGHVTAWLGGTDAATEGSWIWATGPEAGIVFWQGGAVQNGLFAAWNPGEPNDFGDEDYLQGWWANAAWNDYFGTGLSGYVIEYSRAPVPLPAALPLSLVGLAALGVLHRRRNRGRA